jgi:hypothetical protein
VKVWNLVNIGNDAPPNYFVDLTMNPKGEQQKDKEMGTLPGSYHFGGKRVCWSPGMGIRKSDKQVNYSNGLAQTKQQVG